MTTYALPAPTAVGKLAQVEPTWANFIYILGILNSGVSGIKSVQPISISMSGSSGTATITSVNTSKAFITGVSFSIDGSAAGGNSSNWFPTVVLTNATTVTATRTGSTGNVTVKATVVEFN